MVVARKNMDEAMSMVKFYFPPKKIKLGTKKKRKKKQNDHGKCLGLPHTG